MRTLPREVQAAIDSAPDGAIVVVYVKQIHCHGDTDIEIELKKKMREHEKEFYYYTICYNAETLPFPDPRINLAYLFFAKSKMYSLSVDGHFLVQDFSRVIQTMHLPPAEAMKLYPEHHLQAPVDQPFTPEQEAQQKEMLAKEDLSKFPSTFQMARNLIKSGKDAITGVMQGKQLLASADEAARRLEICQGCENYKDKRCTYCGCFMEQKTHLEAAFCPIKKWGNFS